MPKPPKPPKPAAHVWWAWRRPPGVRLRTGVLERLFETTSSNGGMLVHLDDGLLEALVATVADFNTLLSMRGVCVGLRRLVDQYQRRCLGDRIAAQMSVWHGKGMVIMRTVLDDCAKKLVEYDRLPDGSGDSTALLGDTVASRFALKYTRPLKNGRMKLHGYKAAMLVTETCMGKTILELADRELRKRCCVSKEADCVRDIVGAFFVRSWIRARACGRVHGVHPTIEQKRSWIDAQLDKLPAL